MIECPMPQDILKFKPKMLMNLSGRELLSVMGGIISGVVSHFFIFKSIPNDTRVYITTVFILPFLMIGFIKPYGQPFEKIAFNIIDENFLRPQKRLKMVKHPEFEKFEKTRAWEINELEDEETTSTKKKDKNSKVKIAKSKKYCAIK